MPPPRLRSLPAANKIFVNREGPLRIFENAAFDIPVDSARLLTFYGHRWAGQDGALPGVDAENLTGFCGGRNLICTGSPRPTPICCWAGFATVLPTPA
jgi:hypothetical protein